MGIEKFFNTLLSSNKTNLITPFVKTSADILFFDFNSIIHKISSQTISDLNYLYKILLISHKFPSSKLIQFFINKYKNYDKIFYLSIDFLNTPSGILQLINDLHSIDINTIIIHQIIKEIEYYISHISNLQLIYISIDGVPSIGKIMEQRHRRYIGEIINHLNSDKIKSIKYPTELSADYPYDYLKYYNTKFVFKKLHISPNTIFMKKLIKSIKNHNFPIQVQINDDFVSGEGEFKIINFIKNYSDLFLHKKIIIYSPDADMILLSSILPHDIFILRYDQQQNIDYIMSTEIFKKTITKYITNETQINQKIINDIIFIFTIFGDDFLPKLECIQVNNHYDKILDIYKKIYKTGTIINDTINLSQLQLFFNELNKIEVSLFLENFHSKSKNSNIDMIEHISYIRKKKSSFNNDPLDGKIINNINKDIHDSNYLEEKYSIEFHLYPRKQYYEEYKMDSNISSKEYIKGLQWIYNYYFHNKLDYSWYYPFEKAPLIYDIHTYLQKLEVLPNNIPTYPLVFTPIEQAIYTSPIEITQLLSKKYQNITQKFYKKYNLKNILNDIQELDCKNINYLSKCSLSNITHPIYKLSPIEFIKEFRTQSSTSEFLKYIEYYKLTNDPYFYNLIKKIL
jgi:5'-3' exonuclease